MKPGSCKYCGKETSNPKFCSLSCSVKQQNLDKPRVFKPKETRHCKNCDAEFILDGSKKQNVFCSHSCSAKFNNVRKKTRRSLRECCGCGKLTPNKKFCTQGCEQKTNRSSKIEEWLNGGNVSDGVLKWTIRKYLFAAQDNKCSKCGWSERNPQTNNVPLELNHIDGDHTNNTAVNIELICPNCHALTSNFRALNWGNGRPKRRSQQ